ncbi:hypothetical protein RRG08_025431 [Elysia crispata]|uniref:Uncharacterized protein n=1 Tax=Elysia crispata TaxID=231223 RepID=A0AAE1DCH2_9GAST|nr:hypothetical protein RRG08_025431 [Elysia crispata]
MKPRSAILTITLSCSVHEFNYSGNSWNSYIEAISPFIYHSPFSCGVETVDNSCYGRRALRAAGEEMGGPVGPEVITLYSLVIHRPKRRHSVTI